ncbi:MAG: hypothetical protein ACYCO9_17235 [Streptosporangiaceae bacterium]
MITASNALAVSYDCTTGCNLNAGFWYCYAGQLSLDHGYTGIDGYVTDPSTAYLPGDGSNNHYADHIALWNGITEETVPSGGSCAFSGGAICWVQAGMFMGTINTKYYYGGTGQYESYFENGAPNGTYQLFTYSSSQLPINSGSSYNVEVFYDGGTGILGYPQYKAYVNGYYVGAGELYYSAAHAEAEAEVAVSTSACPTLTNGSPYQNFGTDASGSYSSNYEMYLSTDQPETWNFWSGSPSVNGNKGPIYWYQQMNGPAAFRNNGPSSGPA